jgi:hypothetical protein
MQTLHAAKHNLCAHRPFVALAAIILWATFWHRTWELVPAVTATPPGICMSRCFADRARQPRQLARHSGTRQQPQNRAQAMPR